jgi:hypothetical protein
MLRMSDGDISESRVHCCFRSCNGCHIRCNIGNVGPAARFVIGNVSRDLDDIDGRTLDKEMLVLGFEAGALMLALLLRI